MSNEDEIIYLKSPNVFTLTWSVKYINVFVNIKKAGECMCLYCINKIILIYLYILDKNLLKIIKMDEKV